MKTWLLLTVYGKSPAPYPTVPPPTRYDLPFSHNTARLAYHSAYDPSRSSKIIDFHVIWKPTCDFLLVINSNLDSILHCLATIHPWQTNDTWGQRRPTAWL